MSKIKVSDVLSSFRFDISIIGLCDISLQLRDNEQLSRLCAEQETRLGELERQVESRAEEEEDRRRMLEDVQSDKATISRALTQNRTLKDQLAELQNGFVKVVSFPVQLSCHHIHKVLLSVYSLFFHDFFLK